ncbi:bifunctional 5,10-methylene-tetrahydrofolate dehydrogenase/5,10-methylene-tetrahydrofolate cyclohydrolase [Hyphobacterium sp. CCMP332]|nr:bifunctional 5,10-methylene-tetrahydrofolate dehydrogenase/5,10-methylene-tetrahydrofolate cyclohydrolase [Hyphobacterium sp. CCMP332]
MNLLDGKQTSLNIQKELADKVSQLKNQDKRAPHLAAILVGEDGASKTYVGAKVKACERIGYESTLITLPNTITEQELLRKIEEINYDSEIDGLIVQLPLPGHISEKRVIETVKPEKDVDGFHPINVGRMIKNLPSFISATPFGILKLLETYGIETEGKHCVVVGRSQIVGSPMSNLMSRNGNPGNCTVTLCHSRTKNLEQYTKQADILIAAIGRPETITFEMVKEGAIVIDVGTTRVPDNTKKSGFKLKGDVKFDEVSPKCSYITPVPGGVGPMTIAGLMLNTYSAATGEYY